jgi:acyl carrier protein
MASHDRIEERVRAIISRIAKVEPGFPGDADMFRVVGVKSASALEVLLSLEDEFGVTIPDETFGESRTVNALVALVVSLSGVDA